MPSYNNDRFISDAISSVLAQPLDLELIIVDDCSTDRSRDIIGSWMRKDSRVKVVFHERNLGIAITANDGIELARGRYIAFASSDDMFIPNSLTNVVSFLDSREDIGVAVLDAECIGSNNSKLGFRFSQWNRKPPISEGNFLCYLVRRDFICTGVIRKSVLERTGIRYDKSLKYANDWMFWIDLSHSCKFAYLDQPVYRYRIHQGSVTSTKSRDFPTDVAIHDMILKKYDKELDLSTQGLVLRNMGVDYCFLRDFPRARSCLRRCLRMNRAPLAKLLVALLLASSYQMTIFRVFVNIWRHRRPFNIMASIHRR